MAEVDHAEKVHSKVKLASGDHSDRKVYAPTRRHLLDTYIRTAERAVISALKRQFISFKRST